MESMRSLATSIYSEAQSTTDFSEGGGPKTSFVPYTLADHTMALASLVCVFPPDIDLPLVALVRLWGTRGVSPSVARATAWHLHTLGLITIKDTWTPPSPLTSFVPRRKNDTGRAWNKNEIPVVLTPNTSVAACLVMVREQLDLLEKEQQIAVAGARLAGCMQPTPEVCVLGDVEFTHLDEDSRDTQLAITGYTNQALDDAAVWRLSGAQHMAAKKSLKRNQHSQALGQAWGAMRRHSRIWHHDEEVSNLNDVGFGFGHSSRSSSKMLQRPSQSHKMSLVSSQKSVLQMGGRSFAGKLTASMLGGEAGDDMRAAPPRPKNPVTTVADVDKMLVAAYLECLCTEDDWSTGPDDGYFFQHIEDHCRKAKVAFPRTLRWVVASLIIQGKLEPDDYPIQLPMELTSSEQSDAPVIVIKEVMAESRSHREEFSRDGAFDIGLEGYAAQSLTVARAMQRAKIARRRALLAAQEVAATAHVTVVKKVESAALNMSRMEASMAGSGVLDVPERSTGLVEESTSVYRSIATIRLHTQMANAMHHFTDILHVYLLAMTCPIYSLRMAAHTTLRLSQSVPGFYDKAAEALRTSEVPAELCRVMECLPDGTAGITQPLLVRIFELAQNPDRRVHDMAQKMLRATSPDSGSLELMVAASRGCSLPVAVAITCSMPMIPDVDRSSSTVVNNPFEIPRNDEEGGNAASMKI